MSDPAVQDRDDLLIAGDEQVRGRLRSVAVAVVALVLLATGFVVEQRRADRASDQAVASRVRLAVDVKPVASAPDSGLVGIGVRNLGPDRIRVVAARLQGAGYDAQGLDTSIEAGASAAIYLPDTAPCRPGVLTLPVARLAVRVETERGTRLDRLLPLSSTGFVAVNHAARARCGYQTAGDGVAFDVVAVNDAEDSVLLRGHVANRSVLPLSLDNLQAMPGLSLSAARALPFDLPAATAPEVSGNEVPLTLRLRVESCTRFLGAIEVRHHGLAYSPVLRAWVVRGGSITEVAVGLADSSVSSTALDLLKRRCPVHLHRV